VITRFVQRNMVTEQVLPAGLEVEVVRRENHIFGGPKACELEVSGESADMLEMLGWLRDRIEIFDDQGVPVWWGIVSRVEVPVNQVVMVSDLENMANAIKVVYTLTNASGESTGVTQETDWVVNQESIEQYGRKELLLSIGDSNAVAADTRARIELRERAFPQVFGMNRSQKKGRIEGIGEWETLGWQYANVPTRVALAFQTIGQGAFELSAPEIKVAQSFRAATDFRLSDISLYLEKSGGPGDINLEILDFVEEDMPGDVLASLTIPAELIGTSPNWVRGFLSQSYPMTAGKRYFIAASSRWCDQSNFYRIRLDRNNGYPEGTFRVNVSSGWQTDARDMAFQLMRNTQFLGHSALTSLTRRIDALTNALGQQFQLTTTKKIAEASVYLRRVGDPGQLTLTLHEDNANLPGNRISSATIAAVDVGETMGWRAALFEQALSKPAGSYWLTMSAQQADALNFYEFQLDSNQGYAGGIAAHNQAQAYVDGGGDMPFRTLQNKIGASYSTMTAEVVTVSAGTNTIAQTFRLNQTANVTQVKLYLKKSGSPTNLSVGIAMVDANGVPGQSLVSGTIEALDVTTGYQWHEVRFSDFPQLAAYTQYAIVISANGLSGGDSYQFQVDGNGNYPGESAWEKPESGDWTKLGSDLPFIVTASAQGPGWGETVNANKQIGGNYSAAAQQFLAASTTQMVRLELKARKTGSPGDLSIGLYSDASGFPNQLLDSVTIDRRTIDGVYRWRTGWLSKQPEVSVGLSYWIVISADDADSANYYEIGVDSGAGYSGGVFKLRQSGSWTAQNFDMPFRLFETAVAQQHSAGTAVLKLGVDYPMVSQKVTPTAAITLTGVGLKLAKVGQPGNVSVDICKENNGFPGEVLGTATIFADAVGGTAAFVVGALDQAVELANAEGYFLVVKAAGTSQISYYNLTMDAAAGYAGGFALVKAGDVWADGGGDMPFRLYSNDMVETSQQIQSLLTAYGQFFSHIYVDVNSGVSAESYRGGDTDAKVEIEKMLEGGDGENLRLVARVNYDRTVEVRTQEEESLTPMVEMRDDGLLWYRTGTRVEPAFDPTGKWISLEPILRSARFTSVVTGSQQSFILGARWDADGKLEAVPVGWENHLARKVKINNG
jgi:hypothetical protein